MDISGNRDGRQPPVQGEPARRRPAAATSCRATRRTNAPALTRRPSCERRGLQAGPALIWPAGSPCRARSPRSGRASPQIADVDVDDIRARVVVVAPDVREQLLAASTWPGWRRNISSSVNSRAVSSTSRRRRWPGGSAGRARRRPPAARSAGAPLVAQAGPDPGEQLLEAERLGHVVVGAAVETGDRVGDVVAGGEDDDRHALAARAQLAQHPRPSWPGSPRSSSSRSKSSSRASAGASAPSSRRSS